MILNLSEDIEFNLLKIFPLLIFIAILTLLSFLTGKELATLHHICVSHLAELQVLAKTQPAIKKLVTVTDMLTKHKHKYLEMIR